MIFLLAIAAAGIAYFIVTQGEADASMNTDNPTSTGSPLIAASDNQFFLPDVLPQDQGGKWKRDYDDALYQVSQEKKVPFALLKAHAIRESALKPAAYRQEPSGKASFGLLQVLWWPGSDRFRAWGYSDDVIGDGTILYDPVANARISAEIMIDNWNRMHNLRDIVNAYNTGVKESVRVAPGNYVDNVLSYYSTLVGQTVS